jgi:cobalt-zinc-cadmium efflux system protein
MLESKIQPQIANPPCCPYHQPLQPSQTLRSLWIALALLGGFAGIEFGTAWLSHSVSLLAEAGHMLSDGLALGLSLLATWLAQLPPSPQATFGYRRIEIVAALLNGLGLIVVAGWIGWEALQHLHTETEILGLPMLITAIGGLAVNGINLRLLHHGSQQDLNLRGAWLHISSLGVMVAALVIWLWGWDWADSVISLGVAALIVTTALPLIHQSLQILLEQTPSHLQPAQISQRLQQFEGVLSIQNLRVWTIALGQDALSAQLTVSPSEGSKRDRLLRQLQVCLQQEFGLSETFLQLSSGIPELLDLTLIEQIEQIEQIEH